MKTISFSHLQQHLKTVCASNEPVVVERHGAASVVLMAQRYFSSMEETLHLLSSPRNSARLLRSIRTADGVRSSRRA